MTAPASHQSFCADLYGVSYAQGYLDAAGIRTRYLHAGEGGATPLILLHGTGGHADCYTRNLAAHGAHFDTYAIDMVGHGWSDKPEVDLEIDVAASGAVTEAMGKSFPSSRVQRSRSPVPSGATPANGKRSALTRKAADSKCPSLVVVKV